MLHLDPDRLAALADERASAEESAHLAACATCASELAAYRRLATLAAQARAPLAAPLSDWDALSAELTEGRGSDIDSARGARHWWGRGWPRVALRAAAAVLLSAGGVLVGRASVRQNASPSSAMGAGSPASGAQLASTTATGSESPDSLHILTVRDALAVMQRAENDYRTAAAFIAAHDTTGQPDPNRYRTRLAALDKISNAALAAVNEAPSDPVLNQFLVSTNSTKAVTLQQLRRTLPTGYTLTSY